MIEPYWSTHRVYLAAMPDRLTENPELTSGAVFDDVLSSLLSTIRLSGSLQFCFMPTGNWQIDATAPSLLTLSGKKRSVIPFHILVSGSCWLEMGGVQTTLVPGDVAMFPFASRHNLGVGQSGRPLAPTRDLPPKPWRETPVLRYGNEDDPVRLLCGYLHCEALNFAPFSQALPKLIHVRTLADDSAAWIGTPIRQMVHEIDRPRAGSISMLSRLTEIVFIEILRHQIMTVAPRAVGWLAALADPSISRCLALIHEDPGREWSLAILADTAQMSRSAFSDRFRMVLDASPIEYVRSWRLYLASVALATTKQTIAAIAYDAGYESEASFSRAFSRVYGAPPATWRDSAQS